MDGVAGQRIGAIEFRVLGPVEVRVGNAPLDLGAAQLRTLVAALLLDANRVVPASTLVDRLWADKPVASARGSLQAYVSRLRRLLDGAGVPAAEILATRPSGYLLAVPETAVDVTGFERAVRAAHELRDAGRPADARQVLAEGLTLWRGPAYADISVPAVRAEAVRLDEGRWSARELAAELDLALGRHAQLADELLAAVAGAPLRERLRGALMLALYRSGRQADALAVYVEGRTLLAEELGVDPGRELQQLYERVLRQDPAFDLPVAAVTAAPVPAPRPAAPAGLAAPVPAPRPAAPARLAAPAPARPPVVGRDEELARLDAALAAARAGVPTVVTLTGEAGIGKTRLAEEAAARASAAGALVVWGRCWEHEGAPDLWPWTQALREIVEDGPDGRELLSGRAAPAALLLPDPGGHGASLDTTSPARARAQLVDAVAALLAAAARRRPLLVVLEDLHWADQESLHLLELVAAHLRDAPVAVVATVRLPNDVTEDPSGYLLAGLARIGAHRVTLHGLGVDDVRTYITEATGRPVSPEVASAVAARTDGNPFFITQVVRLGGPDAVLDGGVVPAGVREAVARRLRRVEPADRAVLEAAAVAGRVFDLPLLGAVAGVPAPTIDAAVDRALRSGLLGEEQAAVPRFRFAHALVQETLLAEVPRARRARLHDRAAELVDAETGEVVENGKRLDVLDPGESLTRQFRWDTVGLAWNRDGSAHPDPRRLIVRLRVSDRVRDAREIPLLVKPRPVILVHGYKSNAASSWGKYQPFLESAHPLLHGWAVGDNQEAGVLRTGSLDAPFERTNTISENARQEAAYIDGVRARTDAWHVDVVAHSMGGLISRWYVQELMPESKDSRPVVNRLIMMGTPNMGSPCADLVLDTAAIAGEEAPLMPATQQLSTAYVATSFNPNITDRRGVTFSNMVGVGHVVPCYFHGVGDGVVTRDSARYVFEDVPESDTFHTSMTEELADFTSYVLPRLARDPRPNDTPDRTNLVPGEEQAPIVAPQGIGAAVPAVPAGATVDVPLDVPTGEQAGVVAMAPPSVGLTLLDPSGAERGSSPAAADADQPFRGLVVDDPAAGRWTLRLTNTGTGEARVPLSAWIAGNPLTVEATAAQVAPDGTVRVSARLDDDGKAVPGADVEAVVLGERGDRAELTLHDDGAPLTADPTTAVDGGNLVVHP
ncbi:BTAD domain-containing putative transcriptional regulator [Micromonospora sp. NPDC048830]|uniref:BTAD domain-containing putative transcriptional regulator n=1 Tax=Micromonospora sp. NPDC048830 TaxID=3364257 RepID=UPI0037229905